MQPQLSAGRLQGPQALYPALVSGVILALMHEGSIRGHLRGTQLPLLGAHAVTMRCALILQSQFCHVSAPPLQATLLAHLRAQLRAAHM